MGVFFMMGVRFPSSADREVQAAKDLASDVHLQLRDRTILNQGGFGKMWESQTQSYFEFTTGPKGVGYPSLSPLPFPMSAMTSEDLTNLGEQLYGLLAQMVGYSVAYVGWDPEWALELGGLKSDYLHDGSLYGLAGIVLAEDIALDWQLDERFEPFAEGFRWLPYLGTSSLEVS